MLKQWIMENIADFNVSIYSEEDMKIKVLLPYLKSLGYFIILQSIKFLSFL